MPIAGATAERPVPAQLQGSLYCAVCGENAPSIEKTLVRSNIRSHRDSRFWVWRCSHCRSLHTEDVANLDLYYRDYPMHNAKLDYFSRAWYRVLLERFNAAGLATGHRILDYGCGRGHFLEFLEERGYADCAGYDPYVRQFDDTGALQRTYDWVTAIDVIEHVDDPVTFMSLMTRLLKPNGTLCVLTPNAAGISLDDTEKYIHELHVPYHRHIVSREGLSQLAQRQGLRCVAFDPTYFVDTWLPGTSWSFIEAFARHNGNDFDAVFEPPRPSLFLRHPSLIREFFLGYFLSPKKDSQMMMILRRVVRPMNPDSEVPREQPTDTTALVARLCALSPYAGRIEPLFARIPDVMERNDQLQPLWELWRQRSAPGVKPEAVFTAEQVKVLRSFFEYLYFASDAFIRSV